MTITILFLLATFLAAMFAAGLACWLYVKRRETPLYLRLAALSGLVSLVHVANGCGLLDESHGLLWRRVALAFELCLPAALLYAGLRFSPQPSNREWRVRLMGLVGLLLAGLTMTDQVLVSMPLEEGGTLLSLAPWGHVAYAFIVIAMAVGLAQFEAVLRSSNEPVRYRLKLILIGLGGLAGYQIYQGSQMLLLPMWRPEQVFVSGVVTIISLGLLSLGIVRSRFKDLLGNAYVSQQALLGSVTFIGIGLYLLVVGIIGEWLRRINQPLGAEFSVVLVFGALVALVVAAFSRTVRAEARRLLTRNFYRSKYDYRAEWLRVTEVFQFATTKEAILDRLLDLLIKTFSTSTIAIWMFRDADRCYYQARPDAPETEPMELPDSVIRQLVENDEPVMMSGKNGDSAGAMDPLVRLGADLCFPIRAQGRLVAFVVLGKEPHGGSYGTDDCDLLRGICHQAGVLLSHAILTEERLAFAELEALHRFSVFCLHDIKNLAARLSLVAQNAERHGHDPAFQESALRTVADTANKMTSLMSKLSHKSITPTIDGQSGSVDLSHLIEEVVAPLMQEAMIRVQVTGGPVPPVRGVREQIQQVLLNVVLNARQAIPEKGEIAIALAQLNGSAIIRVEDTGKGIPPRMIESLFRPSQSSRPGGLGIGLYQCRKIIEAHGGKIHLRSREGKGTQVQIELPLSASSVSGESISPTSPTIPSLPTSGSLHT